MFLISLCKHCCKIRKIHAVNFLAHLERKKMNLSAIVLGVAMFCIQVVVKSTE